MSIAYRHSRAEHHKTALYKFTLEILKNSEKNPKILTEEYY